jgi:hypothetical protein
MTACSSLVRPAALRNRLRRRPAGDSESADHSGGFGRSKVRFKDRQDAFFVPFGSVRGVERPGPDYYFYQKISAP